MSEPIDYDKLASAVASAQVNYHDDEADKIDATVPDELRNNPRYQVPPRGHMPGAQRLRRAQMVGDVLAERNRLAAQKTANEVHVAGLLEKSRQEAAAREVLGFGPNEALPDNWPEWVTYVQQGGDKGQVRHQMGLQAQAHNNEHAKKPETHYQRDLTRSVF